MFPFDFLREPLWQPLTWTLLHFLWQGAVIMIVVMILRYLLPMRQANHRYLIYLSALLVMAVCPVATFLMLDASQPATIASQSHDEEPPAAPEPMLEPVKVVEVDTALPPAPVMPSVGEDALPPAPIEMVMPAPVVPEVSKTAEAVPTPPPPESKWQGYISAIQPYALVIWIVGVLLLAMRLLLSWLHVRWLRWGCQAIRDELAGTAVSLGKRLGLRFPPRVYASEKIREAIVVGLWRPLVLLPASWLLMVPPEVLEAVIAHELAHIRRFDLWVNLLQRLMETVLFYHPAVWYLSRRLSVEREMCADDLAVCATKDRLLYVTALERLGRMRLSPNAPRLGTSIGGNKMALLNRVGNLLGLSAPNKKARWWPVGFLTLILPLIIWSISMNFGSPTEHKAQGDEVWAAKETSEEAAEEVSEEFKKLEAQANPLGLDDKTLIKLFDTGKVLRRIGFDCGGYYSKKDRLPKDVAEIASDYVENMCDKIGNDPFAPGKKLRLIPVPNRPREIQIWSVGPDGDWDGGRQIDSTKTTKTVEKPLDGDIGFICYADPYNHGRGHSTFLADSTIFQYLDGLRLPHYLAAKGPKFPKPDLKDDGLKWGPVVDGLQLAVELKPKRNFYYLGEMIDVRFHIRNTANYAIQVGLTMPTEQDMGDNSVFIKNKKGKRLKGRSVWMSGTVYTKQKTLKPGETATYESSNLAFVAPGKQPGAGAVGYWVEAKPGVYTVQFKQHFPTSYFRDAHQWNGTLETPPVKVRIAKDPKFAIHLVKGYRHAGKGGPTSVMTCFFRNNSCGDKKYRFDTMHPERYPLKDLVLDGTPLVTEADLVAYNWDDHVMYLKPEAYKRLAKFKPSVWGIPFLVQGEGKPIYLGAFWSIYSSYSADMPTVNMGPLKYKAPENVPSELAKYAVQIQNHWIPKPGQLPQDPRQNGRLQRALTEAGKISAKDANRLPFGKPVKKIQTRLRYDTIRGGELWFYFDLCNDSKDQSVYLGPRAIPMEILIDGIPYHWEGQIAGELPLPVCKPGQRVYGARFGLGTNWFAVDKGDKVKRPDLTPGCHTIQAVIYIEGPPMRGRPGKVKVLSNPVEFEVPHPKSETSAEAKKLRQPPQTVVPLANIHVDFPGHSAAEVERLVTTPLEKMLSQIDDIESINSVSRENQAVITVRYQAGENRERSLAKLRKKISENVDLVPPGVTSWVVKPVEIDAPNQPGHKKAAWGKNVDGLQLGISLEPVNGPDFYAGKTVYFSLLLRNTGKKTKTIVGFHPFLSPPLEIKSSKGKRIMVLSKPINLPVLRCKQVIEPGKVIELGKRPIYLLADGEKPGPDVLRDPFLMRTLLTPGKYRVQQSYVFENAPTADFSGKLTSGELDLVVVAKPEKPQPAATIDPFKKNTEGTSQYTRYKTDEDLKHYPKLFGTKSVTLASSPDNHGPDTWSKAVDGVQCRLTTPKPLWEDELFPLFDVDFRNLGKRSVKIDFSSIAKASEVQYDGVWYRGTISRTSQLLSLSIEPGLQYNDIDLKLNGDWTRYDKEKKKHVPLVLKPGKHTVRFAFRIYKKDRKGTVRLETNPVEFRIIKKSSKIAWGKAVEGLQLGIRLENTDHPNGGYSLGGYGLFSLYVRNTSKHTRILIVPALFPSLQIRDAQDKSVPVLWSFPHGAAVVMHRKVVSPGETIEVGYNHFKLNKPNHGGKDVATAYGHQYIEPQVDLASGKYHASQSYTFGKEEGSAGKTSKWVFLGPLTSGVADFVVAKPKPETSAEPKEISAETPWGKPVEKIQSRLRLDDLRDGVPSLYFDLRNKSSNFSVQLGPNGRPVEIVVDGLTYVWGTGIAGSLPVCKPGENSMGVKFSLDKNWVTQIMVGKPAILQLKPGKHKIQAVVYASGPPMFGRPNKVEVISNTVEIEVPSRPEHKKAAWGKTVDGLQLGILLEPVNGPDFYAGETVYFSVFVRNTGKKPKTIRDSFKPFSPPPLEIQNMQGKKVMAYPMMVDVISVPRKQVLKPGEVIELGKNRVYLKKSSNEYKKDPVGIMKDSLLQYVMLLPGKYRVRQTYTFHDRSKTDFSGILASGELDFVVSTKPAFVSELPPEKSDGQPVQTLTVDLIQAEGNRRDVPSYWIGHEYFTPKALSERISQLLQKSPGLKVTVRAGEKVPSKSFVDLVTLLGELGVKSISLATFPIKSVFALDPAADRTATIRGKVICNRNPEWPTHYMVYLEHESWKNMDGLIPCMKVLAGTTFEFRNLPPSKYTLRARPDYQSLSDKKLAKELEKVSREIEVTLKSKQVADVDLSFHASKPSAIWGELVEGVQCSLRATKNRWKAGEIPTFKADIRNQGKLDVRMGLEPSNWEIEYDGHWYRSTAPLRSGLVRLLRLKPGSRRDGIDLLLGKEWMWRSKDQNQSLEFYPGNHTIRAAFQLHTKDGKPVRVVSSPIEFEISPIQTPNASTAWGKVVDGLQVGLAFDPADKLNYQEGETVRLKLLVRNTGKDMKKLFVNRNQLLCTPPTLYDSNGKQIVVVLDCAVKSWMQHKEIQPGQVL